MSGGLRNRSIVITRETEQAETTIEKIEKLGGRSVLFPTIKIVRSDDRSACKNAAANINQYDWLVFTSTNTVTCFDELFQQPDLSSLNIKVAAIGDKTADTLSRKGIRVDLVPDQFSAKGLIEAFRAFDMGGKRILQPCSGIARKELPEGLKSLGAVVDQVRAYDTIPNRDLDADDLKDRINNNGIDCLTFFSPSAFEYFVDIVGNRTLESIRDKNIPMAAIGPTTANSVKARGFTNILIPKVSNETSLVETITEYFKI